jgi:hypothetical protein
MYWYRDGSALSLLPWLATIALVWLGGWLLVSRLFKLERKERLITGLALGIVLYSWLVNLIARFVAPNLGFLLPAILLFLLGALVAFIHRDEYKIEWKDFSVWPWLLAGLFLVWVFALLGKGLAIFDEQKNLSLISIIANGDVPPRFFLDYPRLFVYHYGFHLFGASLMRLGGMLPWSAFDMAKAIMWGLSLMLAFLVGRRYSGSQRGGLITALVLAFASGARYLLFLLPPSILLKANDLITLQGTSAFINKPFSEALSSGWTIDGGPPMDYIFGFLNGIMDPLVMAHQGPNLYSVLIFLLVWLLLPKIASKWAIPIIAIIFSVWALAWEATYALFMISLFLFALLYRWREGHLNLPHIRGVLWAALISIPVVALQGGTITELLREAIFQFESDPQSTGLIAQSVGAGLAIVPKAATDIFGFSLRWPPAILSAHLGPLNVLSPIQLLVAFFELGPVILFSPMITIWAWKRAKASDWLIGVFALSAIVGFLIPIFLEYQQDRDISRLSWQAMLTWTLLLPLILSQRNLNWGGNVRKVAVLSLGIAVFGGIVIMGIQFTAAPITQLAHRYTELDAKLTSQIWGDFDSDTKIFGPLGTSTVITGQITGQLLGEPANLNDHWNELTQSPNLAQFMKHNYEFVIIDSRRFDDLTQEQRAEFDADCIEVYAEVWDNSRVNFRQVLDIRGCQP